MSSSAQRVHSAAASEPARTCIGCRQRASQHDLLRITCVQGVLYPDSRRRAPGRGAYVHPDLACLGLALKRRAFGRALRVSGELDASYVRDQIEGTIGTGDRPLPSTERIGSDSRMNTP